MDTEAPPHASLSPDMSGEHEHQRLEFLAKASLLLAESLDYDTALESIARLAVPYFADYCALDLLNENGRLQRRTVIHVDPTKTDLVRAIWQLSYTARQDGVDTVDPADSPASVYQALRDHRTLLIPRVTDDIASHIFTTPEAWRVYRELDPRSWIISPLIVRGEALGTIVFVTTGESGRKLTAADQALAEALAAQAAIAVDSAQRFRELQRQAEPAVLLELLLTSMPIGFALVDTNLRFVRVSESLATMGGWSVDKLQLRPVSEVVGPAIWSQTAPFYQRALNGETLLDQEVVGHFPERPGGSLYRQCSYYPVTSQSGEVLGVGVVVQDISERKQAEMAHAASEARYRSLISATVQVIWVTDGEGRMTDWHDWHMFTGQRIPYLASTGPEAWLREAIHADDSTEAMERFRNAFTAGKVGEFECRLRRFDGEYLFFALRMVPVRDEETGRITEWVGAGINVTQRREAEIARDAVLERESRIARTLQRALFVKPSTTAFPGLLFDTIYEAAWDEAQVGGDFYDALSLDDGRVAFVVGDVSGKGIEAAAHTAELKFTLRALLRDNADPTRAVARLNSYLHDMKRREDPPALTGNLVAITVAILSPNDRMAHFVVAGMDPPLIVRGGATAAGPSARVRAESVPAAGLPLGVLPEWDEEYGTVRTAFGERDLLLLTTDGLTEARDRSAIPQRMFGQDGLIAATLNAIRFRSATGSLEELGAEVLRASRAFAGGKFQDDVCLLLARRRRG